MLTASPISGAVSCHGRCSVVGFSSKRFFPPLTVARSHSAPSLHDRYSLLRYYGLSDSREKQNYIAGLPGSSTHLSPRAAPNHPGESDGCFTRYSTIDGRLHPLRRTGHSHTLTRLNRVRLRCGSRVRLARLRDADYSNSSRLLG